MSFGGLARLTREEMNKKSGLGYRQHKKGQCTVGTLYILFIYRVNVRGPDIEPCGTPLSTVWELDLKPPATTTTSSKQNQQNMKKAYLTKCFL